MHVVTLRNGRTFAADSATSILDAARAAGVVLEYSCRTGRCGICKARVARGATHVLRLENQSLSVTECNDDIILTCCRAAAEDVSLDIESLDRLGHIEIKTMPCRIVSLDPISPDILKIVLRTPPMSPLCFIAGQYIDVIAADVRRSYSLANAPRADGLLELIVKRYPGGVLSAYWFERAAPGDLLRIEGPFGTFFLRDLPPTNVLFLATGTGIAPVKALIEELASEPTHAYPHYMRVFWGNREAESFWWTPKTMHFELEVHHVLSGVDVQWTGARAYVQDAAVSQGFDPGNTVVYACGSSAMIASARQKLLGLGLPPGRFFSDAFVSSS